jgi:hypothetical protein
MAKLPVAEEMDRFATREAPPERSSPQRVTTIRQYGARLDHEVEAPRLDFVIEPGTVTNVDSARG